MSGRSKSQTDVAEPASCRLYLVTPDTIDAKAFAKPLAEALDAGDVACLQLRLKNIGDDDVLRIADRLRPIVQERNVAFLLNDRPDLAAKCGADGVHVGQKDMPYAQARRLMGPDRIVGVTCHDSRHFAMDAADAGADYVAFGAFYDTKTKPSNYRPTPDLLLWWSEMMTVPCVAIGGITPENCVPLVRAGADFICVVSGVWECPKGPGAAVRMYNEAIGSAAAE